MKLYAIAFVSTAVVFLALDFVWLDCVAQDFYRSQLGSLLLKKPLLDVAVAFYLLYAISGSVANRKTWKSWPH